MVYKVDLESHKDALARDGYVLLKGVLSESFLDYLTRFYGECNAGVHEEFSKWRVPGKKQQYVFEFPSEDAAEQFRSGIAKLTGMAKERITISERHLKHYDEHAAEYPAPHKDRCASGISVGIPVHLGQGTSVCVFPSLDRSENTQEKAVFVEAANPEELYATKGVRLCEEVGDVIVFEGSSMFHERSKPRGTAVLYIKLNDWGADPLGENLYARA